MQTWVIIQRVLEFTGLSALAWKIYTDRKERREGFAQRKLQDRDDLERRLVSLDRAMGELQAEQRLLMNLIVASIAPTIKPRGGTRG